MKEEIVDLLEVFVLLSWIADTHIFLIFFDVYMQGKKRR